MTLYNTLETFTLGNTYYINFLAFSENVNSNIVTNIFFLEIISEFLDEFLGRSIGLCEVILFGTNRVVLFLGAECYPQGSIAIGLLCVPLSYRPWSCLNDRASCLLGVRIEDAGHPALLSNHRFHCSYGLFPQGST